MDRSKRLVIIPAFNEALSIGKVVDAAKAYANVLVVDDHSKDSTADKAASAGAMVISHNINKGYEEALNSGFKYAMEKNFSYAVTLDADGQHDATDLPLFFENLESNKKLVLGIRPEKARFSEKILGLYFRRQFGVRDILCGMKGYNVDIYKKYGCFDSKKLIGMELALYALVKKYDWTQIPIQLHKRKDNPRFGNIYKANYKIVRSLVGIIKKEVELNGTF